MRSPASRLQFGVVSERPRRPQDEYRPSALERAFALADTGLPISEIRTVVRREGYNADQLHGNAMSKQLRDRAKAARDNV
jgi:hypothetical protein